MSNGNNYEATKKVIKSIVKTRKNERDNKSREAQRAINTLSSEHDETTKTNRNNISKEIEDTANNQEKKALKENTTPSRANHPHHVMKTSKQSSLQRQVEDEGYE